MATKEKTLKLMQEVQGYAQITNRRPLPRPPVLYIMQLREQAAQAAAPKRRLTITTEAHANAQVPLPIKINHLSAGESFLPVVIG